MFQKERSRSGPAAPVPGISGISDENFGGNMGGGVLKSQGTPNMVGFSINHQSRKKTMKFEFLQDLGFPVGFQKLDLVLTGSFRKRSKNHQSTVSKFG